MAIRKLQPMGGSIGITVPKDELEREDLLDDDGELKGDQYAYIDREGDGEWSMKLVGFDS